jgi:hypothetical protein
MIGLLSGILCVLKTAATGVLWALVTATNLLIAAVGSLASVTLGLLPTMPAAPTPPPGSVLSVVNYFLPLGGLVAGLAVFVSVWLAFLVIRIPLKWIKAL